MSLHSDTPFVTEKLDQNDGSTRRLQVLSYSASGCDCTKDFPVNGRAKPEDVIYNMARKAGWSISKKAALCPTHSGKRRTQKEKVPMTYTPGPRQAVAERPAMPSTPELTPELRRSVFRAIDAHYDEAAQCYRGIITDQHIAAETGAATSDVAAIRRENFGPAENKLLTEVMEKLAEAEKRRDQAAAMIADGTNMLKQVNADILALTDLLTKG